MEAGTQSTEQTPAATTAIRQLSHQDYTVGWICALSTEHIAAVAFLDEKHGRLAIQDPNDDNSYTLGRYGEHNTVIAVLPSGEYGKSSAASVARDMLRSFPNIRIGLMVGIGGGAPSRNNDIRLGDVVVSTPSNGRGGVMQYDMGKDIQDERFQISGYLDQPPRILRTTVQDLRTEYTIDGHQLEQKIQRVLQSRPRLRKKFGRPSDDSDRLYHSDVLHKNNLCCESATKDDPSILVKRPQREAEDSLVVHYGLIASGDTLMKNAIVRNRLSGDENVLCFEMEAAGLMNHFPCLVVRGICDYSDTHKNKQWQDYAAMTATAYAKDLLTRMPTRGVRNEQTIANHLRQLGQDLNAIDRKIVNIDEKLIKVDENTSNIDEKMILNLLPIAYGATFDSHSEEYNQFCLPDTRVELLQTIYQWVDDQEREAVFWLNGMAGTGKSTISRTISRSFSESRQLGASFFFKRGETDRNVAAKFFTTIAAQLLRTEPTISPYIKNVVNEDPSIVQKSLSEQFERLILKPLSGLSDDCRHQKSLLIVVDALDECDKENDIRVLIKLFSFARTQTRRLRIFVTSRPELPPRMGFHDLSGKYEEFILHGIHQSVIKKDIYTFLRHELSVGKAEYNKFAEDDSRCLPLDWPTESNLEELLDMTVPLFISAATICRYLFDHHVSGSPATKLRALLQQKMVSQYTLANSGLLPSRPHNSKMDIYQPILTQMLRDLTEQETKEALTEFRIIVGPIVVLATPLSASALARMLDIEEDIIHHRLDHLHSVLSVPRSAEEPIKLFHLSFRDFLLDPVKCERPGFWIHERGTHQQVAENCLRVMEGSLKEDMCGLHWPGSACPSSELVDKCLQSEVRYTCQYWVYHIEQAGNFPQDDMEVYRFLKTHLLHWLEAMALLGRIDEALTSVTSLRSRLQCLDLSAFLDDALRFMLTNTHMIRTAPLQIYSSALIFAPAESIIRLTYHNNTSRYVSFLPQTEPCWSACLHTIEGHQKPIRCVVFSPDGTLIASVSSNGIIQLCSTSTGSCRQVTQQSDPESRSVAFSPDGTRLISVSYDCVMQLWSIDTCSLEKTEIATSELINHPFLIKLSPNGKYVVLCSDDATFLFLLGNTDRPRSFAILKGSTELIAFSANSEFVVTVSSGNLISFWSVDTGTLEKTIRLPVGAFDTIHAISPDATLVATYNSSNTESLWSADTGELLQEIPRDGHFAEQCAFSPDSKLWAILGGSRRHTISIWSVKTGALQQTIESTGACSSLVFSLDATFLASGHEDGKVQLYSVRQTIEVNNDQRNDENKPFGLLAFSPDEGFVVSAKSDDVVLLWNANTGSLEHRLTRNRRLIRVRTFRISPDSQLVAVVVEENSPEVVFWSATTGSLVQRVKGCHVVFSPDSRIIAIASTRQVIQLWSSTSGLKRKSKGHGIARSLLQRLKGQHALELLRQLETNSDSDVASIAISCDSQLVVSVWADGLMRIWSTSGMLHNFDSYWTRSQRFDAAVAISPDSRLVAARNRSTQELLLISPMNFQPPKRLNGGGYSKTNAIAFSPDSNLVAAASGDIILLWSVSTGACLQSFNTQPFRVNRLSFDKTSQLLLSNIGTLRLPTEKVLSIMIESTSTAPNSTSDQLTGRSILWQDYRKLYVGYGLSPDMCWITWNGQNLLWLPTVLNPQIVDVLGSHIALGTAAGRVVIMRLSDNLPVLHEGQVADMMRISSAVAQPNIPLLY
ncbi:Pfs, NACHT and WD domain protein [Xylaria curta]|nr:Pfs, NACHT and WD domain protein [Xylaria curta]